MSTAGSMESAEPGRSAQVGVQIRRDLDGVDWVALKTALAADRFDNGRTPEQLRRSFEASFATAMVWREESVIGTARLLGDGVCNAYLVDVWTAASQRRRGIGGAMVRDLLLQVPGHHVALFTHGSRHFYEGLGFEVDADTGMSLVVGEWLNLPRST